MIQTKICRENQNTQFKFDHFFENLAVCEIMRKNIVELYRPQMTIRHMHFACWIHKATDTHSEYTITIVFPRLQSLSERA